MGQKGCTQAEHGWLDTAVVLHCRHFVLLRRIELFATLEELTKVAEEEEEEI